MNPSGMKAWIWADHFPKPVSSWCCRRCPAFPRPKDFTLVQVQLQWVRPKNSMGYSEDDAWYFIPMSTGFTMCRISFRISLVNFSARSMRGQDGLRIDYHIVVLWQPVQMGLHWKSRRYASPFCCKSCTVEMCKKRRLGAMRTANFGGSVSAQGWKIGSRNERSKVFVCM